VASLQPVQFIGGEQGLHPLIVLQEPRFSWEKSRD
jgi:hypothetical protein